MFEEYTEVYALQKTICAPHEENSSQERQKNPPPCHTNVPMIYTKHINCVFMINNMYELTWKKCMFIYQIYSKYVTDT